VNEKIIKELSRIGGLLSKYKHQYGEMVRLNKDISLRMYKWIDRYNEIKEKHDKEWGSYCEKNGFCPTHDAYDNFA
jgi:hypothetical protein